ncbi:MAG: bifunctional riboflavin kinase/FAD synthetase [Gammaproteobacteria bacterium]|nr:bifunctional riboflavin kinase/FAD synthetase [Gammaproteobacteria bacterium]MCP5423872.1 bifunctional riboflavin kinase/FAD synthetase [Gammaproteobacteria bacterium]
MEFIRGLHNLRPRHHGCVATIGNFDGVHLGHQSILRQLAEKAAVFQVPTLVITFEPQPQEYFARHASPPRLMRLREKLLALKESGIDRVLCLKFDQRLANLDARRFVDDLLVAQLGVRFLVVGDDFRFGHGRRGDFSLLCQAGDKHGFQVANTHSLLWEGSRVSSTRIRQALGQGDLNHVHCLLGRPYAICGRIVHGDQRGRLLGYPTANIHLHREMTPLSGVYVVELHGIGPHPLPGVANVGRRPTVNGTRDQLEVHLFDFQQDIYGRYVQVDFLAHLRPEWRFESLEALREQIDQDARQARAHFAAQAGDVLPHPI